MYQCLSHFSVILHGLALSCIMHTMSGAVLAEKILGAMATGIKEEKGGLGAKLPANLF